MKTIIVLDNFDLQSSIIAGLGEAGIDSQDVIPCTLKDSGLFIKDPNVGLVLIEVPATNSQGALQLVDFCKTYNPNAKVIPIIHEKDSDLILQLVKRGIADVVITPVDQGEIRDIINKLSPGLAIIHQTQNYQSGFRGKIIVVTSYKGGTGVSTVASNLAFALAEHEAISKKVLILDLANQSNHCAMLLDATPTLNINQICKSVGRMESSYIFSSCAFVSPNLGIISIDPGLEGLESLDFAALSRALDLFAETFEYVIVDLPTHTFDSRLLACVDKADQILLVTTIDITAIRDTRLYLNMLKSLGADNSKLRLLVNRYDCQSGMFKTKDLEQALQHPISFYIPNDFSACSASAQAGESVFEHSPKSMLAEALAEVAIGVDSGALFVPPKGDAKKKNVLPGLGNILSGLKK
jgi:pilus assembly protein CpaE